MNERKWDFFNFFKWGLGEVWLFSAKCIKCLHANNKWLFWKLLELCLELFLIVFDWFRAFWIFKKLFWAFSTFSNLSRLDISYRAFVHLIASNTFMLSHYASRIFKRSQQTPLDVFSFAKVPFVINKWVIFVMKASLVITLIQRAVYIPLNTKMS